MPPRNRNSNIFVLHWDQLHSRVTCWRSDGKSVAVSSKTWSLNLTYPAVEGMLPLLVSWSDCVFQPTAAQGHFLLWCHFLDEPQLPALLNRLVCRFLLAMALDRVQLSELQVSQILCDWQSGVRQEPSCKLSTFCSWWSSEREPAMLVLQDFLRLIFNKLWTFQASKQLLMVSVNVIVPGLKPASMSILLL